MGKCDATVKKVVFVFEPELTQCHVAVEARGDCPMGVQGWHHKTFPASMSAVDILQSDAFADHLLWPLNAPA